MEEQPKNMERTRESVEDLDQSPSNSETPISYSPATEGQSSEEKKSIENLRTEIINELSEKVIESERNPNVKPLYHHTGEEFDEFNHWDQGVWFTENPERVDGASQKGEGHTMIRYIDLTKINIAGPDKEHNLIGKNRKESVAWLKKHGFDGMSRRGYDGIGEMHYWIINPDKVYLNEESIPDESQEELSLNKSNKDSKKVGLFDKIFKRKK